MHSLGLEVFERPFSVGWRLSGAADQPSSVAMPHQPQQDLPPLDFVGPLIGATGVPLLQDGLTSFGLAGMPSLSLPFPDHHQHTQHWAPAINELLAQHPEPSLEQVLAVTAAVPAIESEDAGDFPQQNHQHGAPMEMDQVQAAQSELAVPAGSGENSGFNDRFHSCLHSSHLIHVSYINSFFHRGNPRRRGSSFRAGWCLGQRAWVMQSDSRWAQVEVCLLPGLPAKIHFIC